MTLPCLVTDPEIVAAVNGAIDSPCCLCGSTDRIAAKAFQPHFPEQLGVPAAQAVVVPLCAEHLGADPASLEAHLLTARILRDPDWYRWSFKSAAPEEKK